jgi:hypothetical protein
MRNTLLAPVVAALAASAVLAQSSAPPPDFSGDWDLAAALGAAPPPGLAVSIAQSKDAIEIHSSWQEPPSGQYGLTLLGVLVPELRLTTSGAEDLVQVGPFVLHCRTRWQDGRLITNWTSSEFQGVKFEGAWTRALAPGGRRQTLQIKATSSNGARTSAMLTFRRRGQP